MASTSLINSPRGSMEDPLLQSHEEIPATEADDRGKNMCFRRRIQCAMAITWWHKTGHAMWSQAALSLFLWLLFPNHPGRVGYFTATLGLIRVLSPTRWLLNHGPRLLVSIFGMIGVAVASYAILVGPSFLWLLCACSVWGAAWGLLDGVLPSFISEGQRKKYMKCATRVVLSSRIVGPLCVLGLFVYLGNTWTTRNCSIVIASGLASSIPALFLLCCTRDPTIDEDQTRLQSGGLRIADGSTEGLLQDSDEAMNDTTANQSSAQHYVGGSSTLSALEGAVSNIASGMATCYFPVFFAVNLNFTPLQVQLLYIIIPMGQAFIHARTMGRTKPMGNPGLSLLVDCTSVLGLGLMLFFYSRGQSMWVVSALFVVHGCLQNAREDSKSLDVFAERPSSQDLLKCAGAAIGGVLVASQGVVFNLYAAGCTQLIGCLLAVVSWPVTPDGRRNLASSPPSVDEAQGPLPDDNSDEHFVDSREIPSDSDSSEFYDCNGF